MKTNRKTTREATRAGLVVTTDMMMGFAGCGLALAATSFGILMTVRGPAPDFGKSHDFTVFAQLAPRAQPSPGDAAPDPRSVPNAAREATPPSGDLDTTPTASIPATAPKPADVAQPEVTRIDARPDDPEARSPTGAIIDSASVEIATDKAATIMIGGRVRTVRVGDTVPGAGAVLSIAPGRHPTVTTTRGMILSRDD